MLEIGAGFFYHQEEWLRPPPLLDSGGKDAEISTLSCNNLVLCSSSAGHHAPLLAILTSATAAGCGVFLRAADAPADALCSWLFFAVYSPAVSTPCSALLCQPGASEQREAHCSGGLRKMSPPARGAAGPKKLGTVTLSVIVPEARCGRVHSCSSINLLQVSGRVRPKGRQLMLYMVTRCVPGAASQANPSP